MRVMWVFTVASLSWSVPASSVLLRQPAGDGWGEQRVALLDELDRVDQVVRCHVLEQESAGSGGERGVDVLVEVERGQHEHSDRVAVGGGWRLGQDPSGGFEAVQL